MVDESTQTEEPVVEEKPEMVDEDTQTEESMEQQIEEAILGVPTESDEQPTEQKSAE